MGQPWEGRLRVLRDVTVLDTADERSVEFVSGVPGVPGEVVTLELSGARTLLSLVGCVTDSRPVVLEGVVQHAIRMLVVDEGRQSEAGARPATRADVLDAADLVGVFVRETDVLVVNASGSGCLLESATAIEPGTAATLSLSTGTEEYSDAVRVTRCDRIEGGGTRVLIGTEFLWMSAPSQGSLRRAARLLERTFLPGDAIQTLEPTVLM
jgi:hypothetical protein